MDRQVIHRYWSGPPSDLNEWTAATVRSLHPDAEFHMWGPGDWPVDSTQVREEDRVRHESNVVRYKALYELGGLWLDHDVIPLCNLFLATENNWTAGDGRIREGCGLRFQPKHEYLAALLKQIEMAPPSNVTSVVASGAILMNRIKSDVAIERRIMPIDPCGQWVAVVPPIAIHLWETSRLRRRGGFLNVNR